MIEENLTQKDWDAREAQQTGLLYYEKYACENRHPSLSAHMSIGVNVPYKFTRLENNHS